MTVQDDERERELVRLFNLDWDSNHQRGGTDAVLSLKAGGRTHRLDVEVKSTTGATVSTARDVGMTHIAKWRGKVFVIGFYSREARRPELLRCLCLMPDDMAPWIDSIESKIALDFKIAAMSANAMDMGDMEALCGAKTHYTLANARAILKQQWNVQQYDSGSDMRVDGLPCYSPNAMLDIVRRRARYIADRGATLNNPHITKRHLQPFTGTDREITGDWAGRIRSLVSRWIAESGISPKD